MSTQTLTKTNQGTPSLLNNFFKPWNEWFDDDSFIARTVTVPAVNISDHKDKYKVVLGAPGLKKDDLKIEMDGNLLTVSSSKEEKKEEKDAEKHFTKREYSYSAFSRSFSLPDEVDKDAIEAKYEDGELTINLPYKKGFKNGGKKSVDIQ